MAANNKTPGEAPPPPLPEVTQPKPVGINPDANRVSTGVDSERGSSVGMEAKYEAVPQNGSQRDSEPSFKGQHLSLGQGPVNLRAHLLSMWYIGVVIATPILMTPILMVVSDEYKLEGRCGYVIAVMAVFWTTEALPIAVTSLLPVVLLPLFGVMTAREVSAAYFNDTSMLFVGGLLVAVAIEVWDVHKRIALLTLKFVGAEPKCLLLGITMVTWFLSMWISNTATTAMMMTIVIALQDQFRDVYKMRASKESHTSHESHATEMTATSGSIISEENSVQVEPGMTARSSREYLRLSKALSLSVAYAANIGGTGSLTGTGPNMVLAGAARKVFDSRGLDSPITFFSWLVYCLPMSSIFVVIMWLWMVFFFLRCGGPWQCPLFGNTNTTDEGTEMVNAAIRREYISLGPVSYAQKSVFVVFGLLVTMWITRDLGGAGGWGSLFPHKMVSDSTPSLFFGCLLFVLPSTNPLIAWNQGNRGSLTKIVPVLTWKHVHEKMPWSLYLLLGGGYAIAKAATKSGLSAWLGDQLLVFRELNSWVILLIICYIVAMATEVTSNTAMATLMMPILSQLAISLKVNPLFYMYPAAIATSYAFMLPVATPPNAIVFSSGAVHVIDMVSAGFFLNIIGVPILIFATYTWGNAFFEFDKVPEPFLSANYTRSALLLEL